MPRTHGLWVLRLAAGHDFRKDLERDLKTRIRLGKGRFVLRIHSLHPRGSGVSHSLLRRRQLVELGETALEISNTYQGMVAPCFVGASGKHLAHGSGYLLYQALALAERRPDLNAGLGLCDNFDSDRGCRNAGCMGHAGAESGQIF
jgi:hypothetical protein